VPSWGRPPGAKGSKRRREWEREQEFWQQEQSRVEELDSDDTDTQGGVGLNFGKKRFSSDPLHFTGADMSPGSGSREGRRRYAYDDTEDSSESDSEEFEGINALQIALRDKEEALVQSALARIRRAQEKGKREVKLNQDELDALEKRRKRMQAAATTKRQGSGSGSGSERRKHKDRQMVTIPIAPAEPKGRKKGKGKRDVTPPGVVPPGFLIPGADGVTYAPLGYYPPHMGAKRDSPTRPRSSTSQQLRGAAPPQYVAHQSSRYFSDSARPPSSSSSSSRRPLPDEDDWVPTNSRRGSVASQTVDPFEYQTSSDHASPMPGQFNLERRHASGPPEIAYSTIRRNPPASTTAYPVTSRGYSDPVLRQRTSRPNYNDEYSPSSSEDDGDESDELGNGVQVFVEEPERQRDKSISRKPVGGGRKKGKGK
jgi:hypothetical protein